MNLLIAPPGRPAPEPARVTREGAEAVLSASEGPLDGIRTLHAIDAAAPTTSECVDAARHPIGLACPHDEVHAAGLAARVAGEVVRGTGGVLLDRVDAWYAAGPRGTGFCARCASALETAISTSYGEQYVPGAIAARLTVDENAPFHRVQSMARWQAAKEATRRLVRGAREEARTHRKPEWTVGARFGALGPLAIELSRDLDLALFPAPAPSPERSRVSTYELFGAALGRRHAVGVADPVTASHPGLVRQAARLASAVGAELALPHDAPEASRDALAEHRRRWAAWRAHPRALEPLAELIVLYVPSCDHWTRGLHGAGVRATVEALTALGVQYRVVTSLPRTGTEPVVLADAAALPEAEAARLDRRVSEGASAMVVGAVGAVDEEGRALPSPFGTLDEGLNAVGQGTVFGVSLERPAEGAAERRYEPLVAPFDRAVESLLGRGRRAASVQGASLVVKCRLDPERRLDVHLVARAYDPATQAAAKVTGAVLHLSGAAVSGSRTGVWLSEDGAEKKLSLVPFGMGVQVALPTFSGSALLTMAR